MRCRGLLNAAALLKGSCALFTYCRKDKRMTKADFIARVYARSDVALTKTQAEQALNAFWEIGRAHV